MSRRIKIISALAAAASGSAYLMASPYSAPSSSLQVDSLSSSASPDKSSLVLSGPWHVHVLGVLPLRGLSRLWGAANDLTLPVWFRPFGFRLYSRIFGCDLTEMAQEDLRAYSSLGEFFYRRLKEGVRIIDPIASLVSPADGRVLHFGSVQQSGRIEQVKGVSYSLQALLGSPFSSPESSSSSSQISESRENSPSALAVSEKSATENNLSGGVNADTSAVIRCSTENPEQPQRVTKDQFADVNGIKYSLNDLIGSNTDDFDKSSQGDEAKQNPPTSAELDHMPKDVSVQNLDLDLTHDVALAASINAPPASTLSAPLPSAKDVITRAAQSVFQPASGNGLFFAVVYLAPGDYHHFHSPCDWIVQRRRHFAGDLFSVSPFMAARLPNLFVLNERVALLGKWKHGNMAMIPVGATNVGTIKVNFDKDLRTNFGRPQTRTGKYTEAVYHAASPALGGQPLQKGEEMGGFCLGSTVVLVFEAPQNFKFSLEAGQKIKQGEAMGDVP